MVSKTWAAAPFNEDQVKSFNTFQRDERWETIICSLCDKPVYAREDGLICPKCFMETHKCPLFAANWMFNSFKGKDLEE